MKKTNIRDYMNKNNITSSSRESQQINKPIYEEPRYQNERNIDQRFSNNNVIGGGNSYNNYSPQVGSYAYTPKYLKSKGECVDELSKILEEIDKKDGYMKRMVESHNSGLLKKFNDDYDNLAQQIIRNVETTLRENKERILSEIRDRRNIDLAECKPIRRNMDKLRNQVITLKDGLQRDNQYREYISKVVVKDFEFDLNHIQQDIDRLRLPNIELGLDDKYYSCFKSDLNRLIVVRDELAAREMSYSPQSPNQYNSHINRDQIKRSQLNTNSQQGIVRQ